MGKWKKSMHHSRPTTKIAWESNDKQHLAIDYNNSYSIPYILILNDFFTIDSTNSFARIKKLAHNYMRTH